MVLDATLSLLTVRLSHCAYRDGVRAALDAADLGLGSFRWFDGDSTQAMLATDADCATDGGGLHRWALGGLLS